MHWLLVLIRFLCGVDDEWTFVCPAVSRTGGWRVGLPMQQCSYNRLGTAGWFTNSTFLRMPGGRRDRLLWPPSLQPRVAENRDQWGQAIRHVPSDSSDTFASYWADVVNVR